MLDESVEDHYVHSKEPIFAQRTDISGKPGRQNVRPDLLFWAQDDWSGGEGNMVFDPDMANVYHMGSGNTRMEGRITGPPALSSLTGDIPGSILNSQDGSQLTDVTGTSEDDGSATIIGRTKTTTRFESNAGHTESFVGSQGWTNQAHGAFSGSNARYLSDGETGDSYINQTPGAGSVAVTWKFFVFNPSSFEDATIKVEVLDGVTVVATSQAGYAPSGITPGTAHTVTLNYTASAAVSYRYKFTIVSQDDTNVVFYDYVEAIVYTAAVEEVKWGSRSPADGVTLTVNFNLSIESPPTGGNNQVDYTVRIRNATDAVDRATASGTLSGTAVIPLQYTLVAGDAGADVFEYYVKKTSASDLDAIRIAKVDETTGSVHGNNLPMVVGRGAVWVGVGTELSRSTDGINWTDRALQTPVSAGYTITDLATDGHYVYAMAFQSMVDNGTSVGVEIHRVDGTVSGATWASSRMHDPATSAPYPSKIVCTPATRKLYYFAGSSILYELDTTLGVGVWDTAGSFVKVHDLQSVAGAFPSVMISDIVALDDNSVVYFRSTPGDTVVYQFKNGAGRAIWYPPVGFTAKAMCYSDGVLYLVGGDPSAAMPGITLYALRILDGSVEMLGTYRDETVSLSPTSMGVGFEGHLMIGDNLGNVFMWMPRERSFSLLDAPDNGPVVSTGGFLRRHIAISAPSASVYTVMTWEPDMSEGKIGYMVDSGLFDFDIPEAEKVLHGFKVALQPLPAGSTLEVQYDIDNSDSFVSAGTVTLAGSKFEFFPAPAETSTVKFRNMKMRIIGMANDADVNNPTPVCYTVTAVAGLTEEVEVWDVTLRLKDENPRERPTNRQMSSSKLRDWLFQISEDREIVPFIDGYRYRDPNVAAPSVNVIVESPRDVITANAEGRVRVRLRKVGD